MKTSSPNPHWRRLRAAAIAVALVALAGCVGRPAPPTLSHPYVTPAPNPPTTSAISDDPPVTRTMAPLLLPSLPETSLAPVKVGATKTLTAKGLQKLAADVAGANTDHIVAQCATQPSDEVQAVYGSPAMRGAILAAAAQKPTSTKTGAQWKGKAVTLSLTSEQLADAYACPGITWANDVAGLGSFTPAMAALHIEKIIAAPNDKALVCDKACNGAWKPHSPAYYKTHKADAPILTASPAQWDGLRQLSNATLTVDELTNGYYRVRAADDSTPAVAYFAGSATKHWTIYALGEID